MSLESGKKSAAEMRQAQKDMISKAEAVQPTVAVMEPNWNALIASQKAQVKTLGEILEKFDALSTEERLRAHLEMQLQVLRSDGKAISQEQKRIHSTSKKLFWISMIPSLIFFIAMQKHIVGGITAGAVKG